LGVWSGRVQGCVKGQGVERNGRLLPLMGWGPHSRRERPSAKRHTGKIPLSKGMWPVWISREGILVVHEGERGRVG